MARLSENMIDKIIELFNEQFSEAMKEHNKLYGNDPEGRSRDHGLGLGLEITPV